MDSASSMSSLNAIKALVEVAVMQQLHEELTERVIPSSTVNAILSVDTQKAIVNGQGYEHAVFICKNIRNIPSLVQLAIYWDPNVNFPVFLKFCEQYFTKAETAISLLDSIFAQFTRLCTSVNPNLQLVVQTITNLLFMLEKYTKTFVDKSDQDGRTNAVKLLELVRRHENVPPSSDNTNHASMLLFFVFLSLVDSPTESVRGYLREIIQKTISKVSFEWPRFDVHELKTDYMKEDAKLLSAPNKQRLQTIQKLICSFKLMWPQVKFVGRDV